MLTERDHVQSPQPCFSDAASNSLSDSTIHECLLILQCFCRLGSLSQRSLRRKRAKFVFNRNDFISSFIRGLDRLLMLIRNIVLDVQYLGFFPLPGI
jgi:hypothetical protein